MTVAVEVPVYLTEADVAHFTDTLGFSVPLALGPGATITERERACCLADDVADDRYRE